MLPSRIRTIKLQASFVHSVPSERAVELLSISGEYNNHSYCILNNGAIESLSHEYQTDITIPNPVFFFWTGTMSSYLRVVSAVN